MKGKHLFCHLYANYKLGYRMYTHTHIHTKNGSYWQWTFQGESMTDGNTEKIQSRDILYLSNVPWSMNSEIFFPDVNPNPFQPANAPGVPGTGKQAKQWVVPHPESLVCGRLENDWSPCVTGWAPQILGCVNQDKRAPCCKGEHNENQQPTKASRECFGRTEF